MNTSSSQDFQARGFRSFLQPKDPQPVVLIMGPNDDSREMLRVVLELWNYQVLEADNLDDSFLLAENSHPSVILMDTVLPFDDTLDNLTKLRENESVGHTPSVVLSGFSQASYRKEAWAHGAECFMVKPIDFDALHTYIDTLVKQDERGA